MARSTGRALPSEALQPSDCGSKETRRLSGEEFPIASPFTAVGQPVRDPTPRTKPMPSVIADGTTSMSPSSSEGPTP